jgi:hypothetical protein
VITGQDSDNSALSAQGAIDTFFRIDDQHVRALVKTIHGADLDTVGQFALDAALGNDKGHKSGPDGTPGT